MWAKLKLWAGKGESGEKRTQDLSSGTPSLIGKIQMYVQGVNGSEQLYLNQVWSFRFNGDA